MRALRLMLLAAPIALAGCAVDVRPVPLHGHGYYGYSQPHYYAPRPRYYEPERRYYRPYDRHW